MATIKIKLNQNCQKAKEYYEYTYNGQFKENRIPWIEFKNADIIQTISSFNEKELETILIHDI
jgi:hypothetical protein